MKLEELQKKEDERGLLVEAFKLPNDGLVFSVSAAPGSLRGNHYHTRKIEHFLVVAGDAIMNIKDRKTGNMIKVETNGNKPMLVSIYPDHTHNLIAGKFGCVFIVWCNEQFNPDDPDTFAEEI